MFDDMTSLGKQIAYIVVFFLVIAAFLLVISNQSKGREDDSIIGSQELMAVIITGARNKRTPDEIIEQKAKILQNTNRQKEASQLLNRARNHAMTLQYVGQDNKGQDDYVATVWLGRSKNDNFIRYSAQNGVVTQSCDYGPDCNPDRQIWVFNRVACPAPTKGRAICQDNNMVDKDTGSTIIEQK